jgi:chorismate synthase
LRRARGRVSKESAAAAHWDQYLDGIRKAGSSTGAIVEVEAEGVPAGWGAPIYGKIDAELAAALMSINAAKGVEIGAGFASAALTGEENADEMRAGNNGPTFLSNHAGGVLGGISTGQPVIARVAFKPTSSILTPRQTLNEAGEEVELRTKGRHDPCVGVRAPPVVEAMTACVLADAFLRHRGQVGKPRRRRLSKRRTLVPRPARPGETYINSRRHRIETGSAPERPALWVFQ